MFETIRDEMLHGNFSFAILLVGVAQLIVMVCKNRKDEKVMDEIRCEKCSRVLTQSCGYSKSANGREYDIYICPQCDYVNYEYRKEKPLTYDEAIIRIADFYGADAQIIKGMKECVECADALGHFDEGKCDEDAVFDEIADCEIMFDQLRYLLSTHDSAKAKIEQIKKAKIERQLKRIAEDDIND